MKFAGVLEGRHGSDSNTLLNAMGLSYRLDADWSLLARTVYSSSQGTGTLAGNDRIFSRQQLGAAYRPVDQDVWNALARYEHKREDIHGTGTAAGSASTSLFESAAGLPGRYDAHIVSAHVNVVPDARNQLMGRLAAKIATQDDGQLRSTYAAQLVHGRWIRNLTPSWDVGLQGGLLHGSGGALQKTVGAEIGYLVAQGLWVSAGYNVLGLKDRDLTAGEYTSKGAYIRLRYKFDEGTLGLGDASRVTAPAVNPAQKIAMAGLDQGQGAPSETWRPGQPVPSRIVLQEKEMFAPGESTLTAQGTRMTEAMASGSTSTLGRYTAAVTCANTGPTNISGIHALPINVTPQYGDAIVCTVTNTPNAATGIDGVVFRDTGSGGGVANDGLRNGSEAAVAGVTVRLTDCASTVYATATTDAAGAFGFADPGLATSASLCVEETNVAAASVSTGASVMGTALPSGTATSVGGTSYTYTRAGSPDRIAFAWNGTGHSGLAFGDVPDNTFIGNGARKTAPGTSTTYAHTFTAGTAGTVLFDIAGATATPTIGGWSEKIYDDVGCTGKLQASATLLYPPAGSGTAVVAGQNVCIVVQESTPAAAQTGNKNEAQVRAGFTHANAGPTLSASYSVLDTTEVDSSALGLTKEVRNLTTGGPWGTSNQAKSGEVLEYRVTYTNNSLATMSAFAVNDATPQYTTFQSAAAGTTPAALGNCTKATPQNAAPAAQVACSTVQATGGSGAVRWVFDGVLGPSATGDVRMTVVVD